MIESPADALDDHRPAGSPPPPGQELGPFAGPDSASDLRGGRGDGRGRLKVELELFDLHAPFFGRPPLERRGGVRRQGQPKEGTPPGGLFGGQFPGERENGKRKGRRFVQDGGDLLDRRFAGGRLVVNAYGDADSGLPAERSPHPDARPNPSGQGRRDRVSIAAEERPRKRDVDEQGHFPPRKAITFCMSFQTIRLISRFPSLRTR